jgi:hypothetical protein
MPAAVATAAVAFAIWMFGLLALMLVARRDIDIHHPRLARRLDQAVWWSWVGSTAILFGPALGLGIAASFLE